MTAPLLQHWDGRGGSGPQLEAVLPIADKPSVSPEHRLDGLLDKPVNNPRYRGMIRREVVLGLEWRDLEKDTATSDSDTGFQFGLLVRSSSV